MTKHLLFLGGLVCFTACSCPPKSTIREMAIKYEMDSPVNRAIQSYLEYNYHLPRSKRELLSFVKHCPTYDPSSFFPSGNKQEYINYLSSSKSHYLLCEDTCYFFSAIDSTGCIEGGNPAIIINSPWDFRSSEFRTSCFSQSHLLFENANGFESIVKDQLKNFSSFYRLPVFYHPGKWTDPVHEVVPFRIVALKLAFDAFRNGHVSVFSSIQDLNTLIPNGYDKKQICKEIDYLAKQYASSLERVFLPYFHAHPYIEHVIFVSAIPM